MVVTLKEGAGFPVLKPAGVRILSAVDDAAVGLMTRLTITSGSENRGRLATDPHMTGEAVDLSVQGLSVPQVFALCARLGSRLGAAFTVLYEIPPGSGVPPGLEPWAYPSAGATAPHVHVQRKKNTVWPPIAANG